MMKKSQSAIELTMIVSFMFLVFFTFFLVLGNRMAKVQEQKDAELLEELAGTVKEEILLASSVEDGYSRSFEIPQKINGINYSISILRHPSVNYTELLVKYINHTIRYEHIEPLPLNLTGDLVKGINKIEKTSGVICLNKVSCP